MRLAILDTDLFSEVIKGRDARVRDRAAAYLAVHGRLAISSVTVMEIVKGFRKAGREPEIQRFSDGLPSLDVLCLGPAEALVAGRIYGDLERAGLPIGRADPMIAAIALCAGRVLVRGNTAHVERIRAAGHAVDLDNWRDAG